MPRPPSFPDVAAVVSRSLEPIFAQFLDIQRRHAAQLQCALEAGDRQTALRLAHSLRGACATYQLPVAADMAARLEAAGDALPGDALEILAALARYLHCVQVTFTDG